MCDYSLEHVERRPAKVGEQLKTVIFSHSITRGFAAADDPGLTGSGFPNVAVCLLPGTVLKFDRDVECDHALGFFPTKKMGQDTAVFKQIDNDQPHVHHDALEFPSGQVILLTRLVTGQCATVVSIPVETAGLRTEKAVADIRQEAMAAAEAATSTPELVPAE